jgi:hypothetical protein
MIPTFLLFAIAAVLIAIGSDLRQAAGTAGFALIGAAFVYGFDGYTKERDNERADKNARAQDLSETRRLIFIALASLRGEAGAARATAAEHSRTRSLTTRSSEVQPRRKTLPTAWSRGERVTKHRVSFGSLR